MLIATLQNLDQETAAELAGMGSEADYDKLLNNLHNGVECCVLRAATMRPVGDPPQSGYYDIIFADGSTVDAISGYHLRGIREWK
jgi:hypothetical protein